MKRARDVDEYIRYAPQDVQGKLKEMREAIKSAAPDAEEKISYAMPYYGYKGRLAYFAYFKNHIGFYIPPPIIDDHKVELKNYVTATSTVQFPNDQELPVVLIKKLVEARVKHNNAKGK